MINQESERLIWLNDKVVRLSDATINVLSPTSQFGVNVFEGIRCYWNDEHRQLYAFRLDEHYERLMESIKLMKFKNKYTKEEFKKYFKDIVIANNYKEDIAVRQTVFVDGFGSWSSLEPMNMFIAPIPKKRNDLAQMAGLRCGISSWLRISDKNMSPRAKVGANYVNSRMAQLEMMERGLDSAIFMNEQGKIAEGTGSCIFIVKKNKLITPTTTASILDSITRRTIISCAREELKLEVIEREIDRTELYLADEVFLCGSAMEIRHISEIDGYKIGESVCGKITNDLHKLYIDIVSGKNEKYSYWLYPIY